VSGVYLHVDMLDYTLLKLGGEAVDIICKVNENYTNMCVGREKRGSVPQIIKSIIYMCQISIVVV